MTTIIIEQPLATLIVYGKIQNVPDDFKGELLNEENVLVAAGLKSYNSKQELDDILNKYGITDTEDLPDLRFLPQVSFIGFARVVNGKIIYAEPMTEPVVLPSYLHISDKVVNYPISNYNILKFLEDNMYMQEDELQQLLKLRERLVAKKHHQLEDIDRKIAEKQRKISEIVEKDNKPLNETINDTENAQDQDEKSKIKWWHIVLLVIAFGFLCWVVDKISFLVLVAIFFIGQVFIWMTGGKGGLKM